MSHRPVVRVITDSNSGILPYQGDHFGVDVVPMPFFVDGQEYYEGISLRRQDFFARLAQGASISTSQPSPGILTQMWDRALEQCDELVYIPMSSALSSSVQTANLLAQDYGGRVKVVNNQRISCTQKQAVLEAAALAKQGRDAQYIQTTLEARALDASIYLAPEGLEYLRRGGRVTPAAAAISTVLNIKPVLEIQGGQLDAFARVRGSRAARTKILDAIESDRSTRFAGRPVRIWAASSCSELQNEEWLSQLRQRFPGQDIGLDPLPLSICCHTGPGTIAAVCIPLPQDAADLSFA